MDTTNPKTTRGCSETTGVSDTRELKKYVFELTPPRFTTGGLLSSWLADQQFFRDGCKWTLLCPLHPREQGGHEATLLPVLGSGMLQVSRVCRSVTTLCREVFTHLTSGSRRTHLCESKWVHTVVVKQLPVTNNHTRRPCKGHLGFSNGLPAHIGDPPKTHKESNTTLSNCPPEKRQWTLRDDRLRNSHHPSRKQKITTKPGVAKKGYARRGISKQSFFEIKNYLFK